MWNFIKLTLWRQGLPPSFNGTILHTIKFLRQNIRTRRQRTYVSAIHPLSLRATPAISFLHGNVNNLHSVHGRRNVSQGQLLKGGSRQLVGWRAQWQGWEGAYCYARASPLLVREGRCSSVEYWREAIRSSAVTQCDNNNTNDEVKQLCSITVLVITRNVSYPLLHLYENMLK
jgi:hypothetical protein